MIIFRQKNFLVPAALAAIGAELGGATGIMAGMQGVQILQAGKQAKEGAKQAEEQMAEQRRLQNQQIKAQAKQNQQMMNTLKQVAKTNPAVAGAAAGQQMGLMQQQFAIPAGLTNAAKNVGGTLKDIVVVGKKMGAGKKIATGLAMGATAAGAGYLVDKAIQADAKRSGINLDLTEDKRKDNAKKLGKATAIAGGAALAVLGAKKGYLGKSLQGTAKKYITKGNAVKASNTMKTAFKEQFVDPSKLQKATTFKDKLKSINGTGVALTAGFAAMPAISYAANKKAMKEQAVQSSAEERSYAVPANFGKSITTFGKQIVKKVEPVIKNLGNKRKIVASKDVATFKEAPVRKVLGGISSFIGGGGQEGTAKFTKELAAQAKKSGNIGTAKAAEFLGKHKTLAVGGSVAVGSMMFKPFGWGEKAVKTAAGTVDKNSMRYEESQNKNVE